ncbi:MAG: hypothetical protein LKE48_09550 [Solobacterium sp.]|jgi:hypothetical protein|nr:hypothetical protein [Solobacterium sp.]MCH4282145.1 hypothetical protein [Solobacterium sp.]
MMRNSKNSGWWIFLFFFFIVGGFGGTILTVLLPIIVVIAIIVAIAVAASNSANKKTDDAYQRGYQRTSSFRRAGRDNSMSAADIAKINVYLRNYFRSSRVLHIGTSLDLRVHTSTYASLRSLDVYRDGTYICSMDDFEQRYPDSYQEIMQKLASMAKAEQKADVFDAEVSESQPHQEAPKQQAAPQEPLEKNAQYYIDTINALNNDIPDEEITNGLYETNSLLTQIQNLELKFPKSKGKLAKLYDYYLPILIRVLKQFVNLQDAKYDENYQPVKDKLTKTIHLINDAMRTIISSMTDADMMNLSADLSTLEALLQKDGLTGDQMKAQSQEGQSHE